MDDVARDTDADSLMRGRHVLGLMGPAKKDRAKFMIGQLAAMKERWGCTISVMCEGVDRKAFGDLVAPDGEAIARLHLIKEAAWERDPEACAAVDAMMREAERATGVPTGRLILAASHSIGRAYSLPVRNVRRYALVRRIMRDNMEPFRIARRAFRYADALLEKAQPDLIYAFEWGTVLNFAVWLAAQRRGIPCVAVRFSKIHSGRAYWSTGRLMYNDRARDLARSMQAEGTPPSDEALAFLDRFRNQPKVVGYIADRWKNKARRGFIRWHYQNGRTVIRELIGGFRGQDTSLREPPFGRFARYYASLYLSAASEKYFQSVDDETLAETKYVYFPLHKEAELAQSYHATTWHDQRNTVRVLASLLPAGFRLLVREHRMNVGHRPLRSYREFRDIPNLVMIDPFDSQFKYVRNADLVVTENGSTGWEGLVLRRPTLLLAETFYDGAGLGRTEHDPDRLNAAILDLLSGAPVDESPDYDTALASVIDAEKETSYAVSADGLPAAMDQLAVTVGAILKSRPTNDVAAV